MEARDQFKASGALSCMKELPCSLYIRLGGGQSQSIHGDQEKKIPFPAQNLTLVIHVVAIQFMELN
jgi:hypothetical protein